MIRFTANITAKADITAISIWCYSLVQVFTRRDGTWPDPLHLGT